MPQKFKTKDWHTHSVSCWDGEWAEIKEAAGLAGKPVNGWIRSWLKEAARYERLQARELARDERGDGFA